MSKSVKALIILAVLATAIVLLFSGCSKKTESTQVEAVQDVPYIIVSQDTFDSDNFSLIEAAKNADAKGLIKLLAVDVTGRDSLNNGGKLFSILLNGTDTPIFINQRSIFTRVTPSSEPYPDIDKYPNDGLLDTQRPDSTEGLAEVLRNSPKKVVYVVGGHLHNLAELLITYPDLVAEKIETVTIRTGWTNRLWGQPEMNLSQGLSVPNGTGEATKTVFALLPESVKVVFTHDPDVPYDKVPVSSIRSEQLKYLVTNGHYYKGDGYFYTGDFSALLYGITGLEWHGNKIADEVKTCLTPNDYGAVTIGGGECNHYYLDNYNAAIKMEIFKELL